MSAKRPAILDHLAVLADATRCRLLLSLSRQELTVSELCLVLQLPQSTVSRHLKTLADSGWIRSRPEATRRLYSFDASTLEPAAGGIWQLAREQVTSAPAVEEDARRLDRVLALRRKRSREFFDSTAGQWDRMRDELFGARASTLALLGLLPSELAVADLGCGTGPVVGALAPFVQRVWGVDASEAMLEAARARLSVFPNVELRRGQLEALPLEDCLVDAATLILVLHHVADPVRALSEVARVLRPGGRLLIVDMLPHDRQEYVQEMGHVWLGFSEQQLNRLLIQAGLAPAGFHTLPADPAAKGPSLFSAAAIAAPSSTLLSSTSQTTNPQRSHT